MRISPGIMDDRLVVVFGDLQLNPKQVETLITYALDGHLSTLSRWAANQSCFCGELARADQPCCVCEVRDLRERIHRQGESRAKTENTDPRA